MYDPFAPAAVADPYPARQPGETAAQYSARVRAWELRNPGQAGSVPYADAGIPPPAQGYAAGGSRLGDYASPGAASLPQPVFTGGTLGALPGPGAAPVPLALPPPGWFRLDDPPFLRPEAPPSSPPLPAAGPGPYRGPADALAPGLRVPLEGPPLDLLRAQALAATGFDIAWGTPPDGPGLRWDASRLLYAPAPDAAGVPYRMQASMLRFEQAYQDPALAPGAWRLRWVEAQSLRPDPSRPYRVLGPGEALSADAQVQQYLATLSSPLAEARAGTGSWDAALGPALSAPPYGGAAPAPPPLPPGVSVPARRASLADYAWVPQSQLPLGCPYPYAYLPVPQADYASGAWLRADYVPSIPLPPPYDQAPWQCGVPAGPAKKKGGGGDGLGDTTAGSGTAARVEVA